MSSNQATVFLEVAKFAHSLRWFGDPILRRECKEISLEEITSLETQELARKLVEVLKEIRQITGIGRGLAAPQIGVAKRIIVIYYEDDYQILVNPKIVYTSKELCVYPEMCLSGLPMSAKVTRPCKVDFKYQDIFGHSCESSADPLLSRILQHEVDHLDGILFTDRAEVQSISFVSDFERYKDQSELVQL